MTTITRSNVINGRSAPNYDKRAMPTFDDFFPLIQKVVDSGEVTPSADNFDQASDLYAEPDTVAYAVPQKTTAFDPVMRFFEALNRFYN